MNLFNITCIFKFCFKLLILMNINNLKQSLIKNEYSFRNSSINLGTVTYFQSRKMLKLITYTKRNNQNTI